MSPDQSGIAMVAVLVFLLVIAAVVALKGGEELGEIHLAAADAEVRRLDYVAQAGMQRALWQAENASCTGDFTIPATAIGPDTYSASTTGGGTNTVYTLLADQDAWIRSDNPTNTGGGDQHVRSEGINFERPLYRFDLSSLPPNAQVKSAIAWFYLESGKEHPEGPVTINRVTADWTESDATWEALGDKLDPAALGMIPAQAVGGVWVSVNLTAQVQAWVNGQPNYGIALASTAEGIHAEYKSREDGSTPPRLEVTVGTGSASPLNIQATGTLETGVTHTLSRPVATAYQSPGTMTLQLGVDPGEDAMPDSFYSARNYGGATYVQVNDNGSDWQQYPLIRFDLGKLPRGAAVRSAQLELHMRNLAAPGTATIHQVTRSWVEGTKSGGGTADGVSWFTYDGTNAWTSAGGDFNPGVVAETAIDGTETWVSWDVAPLVERWLAGDPNYGLMIRPANGLREAEFSSKEDSNVGVAPKLTIEYACECGSACMAPQGAGNVLMVVVNPTTLVPWDAYKKALFESWGYAVSIISESANQSAYDAATATADAVFISESVNSSQVGTKLQNVPIGVVSQDGDYNSDLGLAGGSTWPVGSAVNVADTDHYITRPFAAGPLEMYSAAMEQLTVSGAEAPGLQTLADAGGAGALVVLDKGAMGTGGSPLPGRRVMLPLGRDGNTNWDYLNSEGLLLVQRAIAWAMGADETSVADVLLVVVDPGNLTAQEAEKQALMESWNFTVNLIDESDSQAEFDAAFADNDVAYIPQDINSSNLGTKLRNATIGVVNEEGEQVDELGFSSDKLFKTRHEIDLTDNSHYITQNFATGLLTFVSSDQSVHILDGGVAPGLQVLAETFNVGSQWKKSMGTLEPGDTLSDGGSATGRRVQLPWGGGTFDINQLNDDGRTIMQRAIEWAEGAGPAPAPAYNVLMIVGNLTLSSKDVGYKALIESWGHTVSLIDDGDSQANYDVAMDAADVILASGSAIGSSILDKPTNTTKGMVNEVNGKIDNFGFSSSTSATANFNTFSTTSPTHYITEPFAGNAVTVFTSSLTNPVPGGTLAPDLQNVGEVTGTVALGTLDAGATRYDSNPSQGRRAHLPYANAETTDMTADGKTILQRTLEWAAGAGAGAATMPIAHWKFDEGSGPTAFDSVGGNDATLNGNPTWTIGTLGDALDFDGSGDYVTTDSNFTPPPIGTVTFWMQVSGSPASHGRCSIWPSLASTQNSLRPRPSTRPGSGITSRRRTTQRMMPMLYILTVFRTRAGPTRPRWRCPPRTCCRSVPAPVRPTTSMACLMTCASTTSSCLLQKSLTWLPAVGVVAVVAVVVPATAAVTILTSSRCMPSTTAMAVSTGRPARGRRSARATARPPVISVYGPTWTACVSVPATTTTVVRVWNARPT